MEDLNKMLSDLIFHAEGVGFCMVSKDVKLEKLGREQVKEWKDAVLEEVKEREEHFIETMKAAHNLHRKDDKNRRLLIDTLKLAYRKHHMADDSIGSGELSNLMFETLCDALGPGGFSDWIESLEEKEKPEPVIHISV